RLFDGGDLGSRGFPQLLDLGKQVRRLQVVVDLDHGNLTWGMGLSTHASRMFTLSNTHADRACGCVSLAMCSTGRIGQREADAVKSCPCLLTSRHGRSAP